MRRCSSKNTRAVVKVKDIRAAIADYIKSEGCDCCSDVKPHIEAEKAIAALLGVPTYDDGSGFDFSPYETGN